MNYYALIYETADDYVARRAEFREQHLHIAREYLDHFSKIVLPELRRVNGFLGATVSFRHGEKETEIFVETAWRSLEAVRAFAGPDLKAAVVAPEAAALLTDYDRRVGQLEIAISAPA